MTARSLVLLAAIVGPGLLDRPASAQGTCDRACLEGIADNYLDALAAHDPKRLPLASAFKYTENGQRLLPGDGFWNSVRGKGTYKLHVADVTAGQIVTFATMREELSPAGRGGPPRASVPMILAVRLKIDNRRLAEIETLLAHSEGGARNLEARGKPRAALLRETPKADRVSRAELVRVANMYFSGMLTLEPFSEDQGRSAVHPRGIPPISFLAPYGFTHPLTRTHGDISVFRAQDDYTATQTA